MTDFDPTEHELHELIHGERLAEFAELAQRLGTDDVHRLLELVRLMMFAELVAEVVTGRPRLRRPGPSPN